MMVQRSVDKKQILYSNLGKVFLAIKNPTP